MKKLFKKIKATTLRQRLIIGGIFVLLLGVGTATLVHHHNLVSAAKQEKLELAQKAKKAARLKAEQAAKHKAEQQEREKALKDEADKQAKDKAHAELAAKVQAENVLKLRQKQNKLLRQSLNPKSNLITTIQDNLKHLAHQIKPIPRHQPKHRIQGIKINGGIQIQLNKVHWKTVILSWVAMNR